MIIRVSLRLGSLKIDLRTLSDNRLFCAGCEARTVNFAVKAAEQPVLLLRPLQISGEGDSQTSTQEELVVLLEQNSAGFFYGPALQKPHVEV